MTDFKTDVEKAATKLADNYEEPIDQTVYESFVRGAQFGRERGFQEACDMLRNSAGVMPSRRGYAEDWADWLEEKRKEIGK